DDIADGWLPADHQAQQNSLYQAYRFYTRPGSRRPDFADNYIEPSPAIPKFDFHQRVALLADHPVLLRMAGLVIDLEIDLAEPVGQVPGDGVVRVVPEGDWPAGFSACPGTRYELDADWFGAKPTHLDRMERGMLRLTPEFWDLFQVDVDGA